ncbi:methyltransferase domain-containing protein [Lutimaribacter sp. EGI FJ00015]|uniref:Methyltransferase domain-containing protein n=1 Tax=Lutimaribacter degradans TaxID=2945989 RepID=A0ACC5ZUU7_9RHOB|nr:methyltransferase domain-containing protein [Lutimaribacter sp. EGI FJ00013]MCM2562114.1 methyltransferase domain-containing protein [Lutimaribacter sp. EGI FJ00013]MCO0613267.1 methyltransferase domain-containing protein [Lutimaribacter sp. EGI FJ00015]MCO0636244.1 methyltransferase domain-containing protein [Lutimaribacter sp. EGI FJ00014]
MTDTFLNQAYSLSEGGDSRKLYAEWAESYEADLATNGYATPLRLARALARFAPDPAHPLLDYGCGTGLSGVAFEKAGFSTVDGIDVSPEMLDIAKAKETYRSTILADPDAPPPVTAEHYPMIAAVGVIGAGAAPLPLFDELMHLLPKGGLFAFSFNDHTLEHPEFEGKVNEWVDPAAARLLFREHGPHLPGKDLGAIVYVLERL